MDYRVGLTQSEVNKRIERGEVNRMKTTTSRSSELWLFVPYCFLDRVCHYSGMPEK